MHDKDAEHAAPPEAEPSTKEPPGRVEVDARGHNVWRWTREANDSTSVVLKRLDNEDLALEPTRKVPIARAGDAAAPSAPAKGTAPKGAAPKSMVPKNRAVQGAAAAKTKKSAADAKAPKNVSHPAPHPDHGKDRGGGFDPYNSR